MLEKATREVDDGSTLMNGKYERAVGLILTGSVVQIDIEVDQIYDDQ